MQKHLHKFLNLCIFDMKLNVLLVYFIQFFFYRLKVSNILQLCVCEYFNNFLEFVNFLSKFLLFFFVYFPVCISSDAFSPCGGFFRHFVALLFRVLCYTLCKYIFEFPALLCVDVLSAKSLSEKNWKILRKFVCKILYVNNFFFFMIFLSLIALRICC